MNRSKKVALVLLWMGVAAAGIVIAVLGPPVSLPRAAEVASAQRTHEHPITPVAALGEVRTRRSIGELTAGAPGRVARVLVQAGDAVNTGDLLVELESENEGAALRAAEAELASARAELRLQQRGLRPEDREALEAEAETASLVARRAAENLERLELAARGGGVSVSDLENQRGEVATSTSSARAAAARARAGRSARSESVEVARAHVARAEASLDEARARIAQRRVLAPWAGHVLSIGVEPGEYVQPGSAGGVLVELLDDTVLEVRLEVDEIDVARIADTETVTFVADAMPDVTFRGHITRRGLLLEYRRLHSEDGVEAQDTRILEVLGEIDEADGLLPGMRVLARFDTDSGPDSTTNPTPSP